VAQVMADTAAGLIKRRYPDLPVNIKVVKELDQDAFGTGCSIM